MSLSSETLRNMYYNLTDKEKSRMMRLGCDTNNDGTIQFNEFKSYMDLMKYAQERANKYICSYKPSIPIAILKTDLQRNLEKEKGVKEFEDQLIYFNQAFNIANNWKNSGNSNTVNYTNKTCDGNSNTTSVAFHDREQGDDDNLNYGELVDFFHMFRFLKNRKLLS